VLGGATPADSPFLRRPDVLASLIAYWHNHPSLSYLFSGLFIGPTSQAPRVDEARNDQVYELEIAFDELRRQLGMSDGRQRLCAAVADRPDPAQPADRRDGQHAPLRVLHRQAVLARRPDRPAGPAGAARVRDAAARAHEPGAAVAAARADGALLAHALHGAADALGHRAARPLHAGHFVQMDFDDVLAEMRAAGFVFESNWFAPHFEFRFPRVGEVDGPGCR
jgi:uncharacterized protein (DUF2126 family)